MGLKERISVLVGLLLMTTLIGGVVMIWYTYDTTSTTRDLLSGPVAYSKIVHNLQHNLLMQKGTVTYYSRDRDPAHLKELERERNEFLVGMKQLQGLLDPELSRRVTEISLKYTAYMTAIDRVLAYYSEGKEELAVGLHQELRKEYLSIVKEFELLWSQITSRTDQWSQRNIKRAEVLRIVAMVAVFLVFLVGTTLIFLLLKKIINPLQEIFEKVSSTGEGGKRALSDLSRLKASVDDLINDMGYTQEALEKSRETLVQAEKMALVGRLAAGTAHSIRNPLTSVKMRLYSLSRSLDLTPAQKEDFDVISEEIRLIDNILQNFLDFARPPKLKPQAISPSQLVDDLLELLHHRLISYSVSVKVMREGNLPEVMADPELLKEAMANIIINACEAMEDGGELEIGETISEIAGVGRCVCISFTDNGPGMEEGVRAKVFQPFFTTKDQGTGLGLSIANRIVQEHGGRIDVQSVLGMGTTFTVYLPTIR